MNEGLYRISRVLEKDNTNEVTVKENDAPAQSMAPSRNGEWVCKKCRTKNTSSTMICKVCGEYR